MIKFILQAAISLMGLIWVFYCLQDIVWESASTAFSNLGVSKIITCFLLVILIYITRLCRLGYWVESFAPEKLSATEWIHLYLKSIAFGSITPARLGDLSRITLLANTGLTLLMRSRLTFLDKFSDVLYIPLGMCLTSEIAALKINLSSVWIFTFGVILFVLYVFAGYGFGNFLGLKKLAIGWGITLFGFFLFIFSNALLFWAVGIDLSLFDITAIILSVGVLASLPLSIGGIGIREGSLLSLLGLWGIDPGLAPPVLFFEFILNIVFPIILYILYISFFSSEKNWRQTHNES